MTPDQLRELYLTTPASFETRALAVLLSVGLVALVLWLVKRRSLREEYTPIWLGVAVAVALVSAVGPLLHWIARAVGAWTPSSALFFFGQIFLVAICLNYAVRLSQLTLQVKNLAQELALLRSSVDADHSSLEAGDARR